jgi:hypothetical protein
VFRGGYGQFERPALGPEIDQWPMAPGECRNSG